MIAHINDNDKEQSVLEHSLNTANLAKGMCRVEGLEMVSYIAGLLHDAGKQSNEFLEYIINACRKKIPVVKGSVVHSSAGAYLITKIANMTDPYQQIVVELIRHTIISHHGLYDGVNLEGDIMYEQRLKRAVPFDEICSSFFEEISEEELGDMLNIATSEFAMLFNTLNSIDMTKQRRKSTYFYLGMCSRMISSLVIDADRIDTACFMDDRKLPEKQSPAANFEMWNRCEQNVSSYLNNLRENKKSQSAIDEYRVEISQKCADYATNSKNIIRLAVPTGGGKTLSSLRYAVNRARELKLDKIFYIAPFNSILEQNAQVVRDALGGQADVLEHHCGVVDETDEENRNYKELSSNWDAPVVLTSAVQFLNTLFSHKTSSIRRMHSFANSVIIIDEVQAIPIRCTSMFNQAINFLANVCNTTIVFCSATQPVYDELINNALIEPIDMLENSEKYRLLFKRTEIVDLTKGSTVTYKADEIAMLSLKELDKVNSVLIIANTKKNVSEIYAELMNLNDNESITICHLSTNMCPKHRKKVIQEIRNKTASVSGEKLICVSSQLIEAGVDISFGTVFRSLAGLDSIVQAAGRCNRNAESDLAYVYIIGIESERLTNLEDIKIAKDTMASVLYLYHKNPQQFDGDLLSKKAMDCYYRKLFSSRGNILDYPVREIDETIYTLLSTNEKAVSKINKTIYLGQAFKTAGEYFAPIENTGMIDIVVEYDDECREIIKDIESSQYIYEKSKLIRKLQPYSVSVSRYLFEKLERVLIKINDGNINILPRSNYNANVGVDESSSYLTSQIH